MPKLSVIIPVYNEGSHLGSFLKRLLAAPCPIEREFILVDDGSEDETSSVAATFSEEGRFRVVRLERNHGKGTAIRRAIREASGDFMIIQDADYEYDPRDVPRLLEPLLQDEADVVYGSRFRQGAPQVHRTYHYFVNRTLTLLSNLLSGIYLTDMETCYKVFRADFIKSMNLTSDRFGIEVELTAYTAKTRARVQELPISYHPRTRLQGKKISWRDGFAALRHLVYYNLFRSFETSFTNLPGEYYPENKKSPPK